MSGPWSRLNEAKTWKGPGRQADPAQRYRINDFLYSNVRVGVRMRDIRYASSGGNEKEIKTNG